MISILTKTINSKLIAFSDLFSYGSVYLASIAGAWWKTDKISSMMEKVTPLMVFRDSTKILPYFLAVFLDGKHLSKRDGRVWQIISKLDLCKKISIVDAVLLLRSAEYR